MELPFPLLPALDRRSFPLRLWPTAHGHWCTFTDIYHTIPYQAKHARLIHNASIQQSQWFKRSLPLYQGNLLGDRFISEDPLHGGVRGSS